MAAKCQNLKAAIRRLQACLALTMFKKTTELLKPFNSVLRRITTCMKFPFDG